MAAKLRRAPGRIVTGAFIVNSGLGKLKGDEATAKAVHGMAAGAYPMLSRVSPKTFLRGLGAAEVAVGGALLLPIVPAAVAGAGLAGFSGGLLGLYWRTPGLHPDGDPRPTQQGVAIAKDVWLAGIAAGLIIDGLLPDIQARRAIRRAERKAGKAEAAAVKAETRRHQRQAAHDLVIEAQRRSKAAKKATKAQAKTVKKTVDSVAAEAREGAATAAADALDSLRNAARAITD